MIWEPANLRHADMGATFEVKESARPVSDTTVTRSHMGGPRIPGASLEDLPIWSQFMSNRD